MRRCHDLWKAAQILIGRRLGLKHVQPCTRHVSGGDRLAERDLVDQVSPRGVDDAHPRLAACQPLTVEQARGAARRWDVQREEIGAVAELVERHQLDPEILGDLGGDERVMRNDVHLERARPPNNFPTDASQTDQAERLAPQFCPLERLLLPSPVLHLCIRPCDRACQREHEGARVLGDADTVGSRRVHDEDASLTGCGEIDVVDTGTRARDDAERGRGRNEVCIDPRCAAHDQTVGVGDVRLELGTRSAATCVDCPSFAAKEIGRRGRKRVSDENFHGVRTV